MSAIAVYIETYGCQMNVYDSAAIRGLLATGGYVAAPDAASADVILLNTCSVREHAEHRVFSRIGQLRSQHARPDGRPPIIGVCGCMAERLGRTLVKNGSGIDLAVGVDGYDRLAELLAALVARRDASAPPAAAGPGAGQGDTDSTGAERTVIGHRADAHYVAPPEAYPQGNSHLVTIHKGCDYRCTYCIVPTTRGPQREKAPAAILAEIAAIVAAGGEEITLLGQNVTAYHWRGELDFAGLLGLVAATPGLKRIRFLTGHPRDLNARLLHVMAELPQVCPWLHVPAQSGSDRILRRMKRLYTRAEYLEMVALARRLLAKVTFSSDFIVGFPGETEVDFRQTLELVRDVGYDQIFTFKYSARPDTPAARLADDVPVAAKKRRLAELMAAQSEAWRTLADAQLGQVWRVALEGRARRPAGFWKGRTANNRKVLVPLTTGRVGAELDVRVTSWDATTFRGEPLAEAR